MTGELVTPMSPGALITAADWLQQVVSGSAAMMLGVIAIAVLGLAMFNGQLPLRRGLAVVAGCFLLFGAPAIGRALMGLPNGAAPELQEAAPLMEKSTAPLPEIPAQRDPYAGAGLITH
jgi:type IV secretory pathway VirB2 component (pilin)